MPHKFSLRLTPLPAGADDIALSHRIATVWGVGRLRPAPGTLGTLAALPAGYLIAWLGGTVALLVAALALLWLGARAADAYGKKSGTVDDQSIVIDEVVGLWISALPALTVPALWVLAFVLFRFFDIYKPWPASYFDNKKRGGWDVMLDDVVAGLFALGGVALAANRIPF